jgi:hypothetical protein
MNKSVVPIPLLLLVVLMLGTLQAQDSREVRKSGQFEEHGRLSIDTYKGSVKVLAWDKPQIEIVARIEPDDRSRYAREMVEDTEVRIELSTHSARIKTDYDRLKEHRHGFLGLFGGEDSGNYPLVLYTIKVPKTTIVEIKDYKSQILVNDLESDLSIETYKGEVNVDRMSGSIDLETYKGEVRVGFSKLAGRCRFETYRGQIDLGLPRGHGFELDASIGRRGNLDSDFAVERSRRQDKHKDTELRTAFNGGGPLVRVKTDRGTIRLLER